MPTAVHGTGSKSKTKKHPVNRSLSGLPCFEPSSFGTIFDILTHTRFLFALRFHGDF